ncbi:MAG: ankyrin repeat domain-containing protein [Planctomycetota bacterium]
MRYKAMLFGSLMTAVLVGCGESSSSIPPEDDSIWLAASEGRVDSLRAAVALGVDLEATFVAEGVPGSGGTPLHVAAISGQAETVEWLIGVGVDLEVRARDDFGGTPLHWAAAVANAEITELLLDGGAEVNAGDANGYTPLDATFAGLSSDQDALVAVRELLVERGGASRDD